MKVVTEIKYIEVDVDEWNIRSPMNMRSFRGGAGAYVEAEEVIEHIRGRRFVRHYDEHYITDGRPHKCGDRCIDVCIGMSADAQELLGLQCEAWENLENSLDKANTACNSYVYTINKLETELTAIKIASIWQRFKWLFTGININ